MGAVCFRGESLLDRSADAMDGCEHRPFNVFFRDARLAFRWDELGQEIMGIALPGALALMADPVASLVDTAFIGHIGPVELAAVGVSIAVFNQVSRIAIFPLVSVTTSFVAEEDATSVGREKVEINGENEHNVSDSEMVELISPKETSASAIKSSFETYSSEVEQKRKNIPSVSTALVLGGVLGLLETLLLVFCARPILGYMGVKPDSAMLKPALQYLVLRSLGAPAVLLSLAMQGVFRGLKDTKTPLYATVAGDATNIVLDPIFMFVFQYGVRGAAIAHVISQYFIAAILLWRLRLHVDLLPADMKHLQFGRFLKKGFLLLARVIAATCCVTLCASMAARLGATPMAAFQICLQIWLASSLLADGLAFAGQAILASAFARKDYSKTTATASRVLQFVCITQPINALAFVFDGINYGASDFGYAAYSMVLVAIVSIICIVTLASSKGFIGIWIALAIYMSLRMFAGFWRIGTARGPWAFLRG
ncbi:protein DETOXIFICATION 42 isoform X2 [Phragmites australis]|uniref:protein DETOXIFICATION 42 isoform X2 n=1 Tax=Phragmites australis TaxID=29695 RepID=UPI002D792966|nr:protein DETOXIFICATION 42 isoform X2 [Phragmites australis]